jgi:hydroxymethylpyrimidine/phosphomethylpyrimidine kinase
MTSRAPLLSRTSDMRSIYISKNAKNLVSHKKTWSSTRRAKVLQGGSCSRKGTNADSATACTAYSRYILDVGQSQDWLALQIALLPCLLGYGMIGTRLKDLQTSNPPKEPNAYLTWINNYVADDYAEAVRTGRGMIESTT